MVPLSIPTLCPCARPSCDTGISPRAQLRRSQLEAQAALGVAAREEAEVRTLVLRQPRRAGQGRAGQGRAGQGREGKDRAGQDRTAQGRAAAGRVMAHPSHLLPSHDAATTRAGAPSTIGGRRFMEAVGRRGRHYDQECPTAQGQAQAAARKSPRAIGGSRPGRHAVVLGA